jgi:F0F1-type ATP synthase assembly protein I
MNKVDKLWNFVMEFIGTPVTVFIFLSWYTNQGKNSLFITAVLFIAAVVITAVNYRVAFIEALFGSLIMFGTRQILMIPIKFFWMQKPFTWFDQQTACAGVLAVFIVHIFLIVYNNAVKNSKK